MGMGLTLVLVRHGETEWNVERRYGGDPAAPLTDTGRSQARALAKIGAERHDTAWTSPFTRCVETATLMGVDAVVADELQEFDFGDLDGLRWDDLQPEMQTAIADYDSFVAPGGDSVTAFGTRIDTFVTRLRHGRHLLVTHGGVIRHLLRCAGREEYVPVGSAVVLELSDGVGPS